MDSMTAIDAARPITLATERLSCRIDPKRGTYSLYNIRSNMFVIDAAAMAVVPPLRSGSPPLFLGETLLLVPDQCIVERDMARLRYEHPSFPLIAIAEFRTGDDDDPEAVSIRLTFHNGSSHSVQVHAFYPLWIEPARDGLLDLGGSWSHAAMLISGQNSWSDTKVEFFSKPDGTVYESSAFTLFYNELSEQDLLLGFETLQSQFTRILFSPRTDGMHAHAVCEVDDAKVAAGQSIHSERLVIRAGEPPRAQTDALVGRIKRANEVTARPLPRPLTGWTSRGLVKPAQQIAAPDILAQARKLAEIHEATGLSLQHVIVDDGWQTRLGEWLSVDAERFPEGMDGLAASISALGRTPGLWIAPFLAQVDSDFYDAHRGWFVKDEHGKQMRVREAGAPSECCILDATNPDALEWLALVFHTISHEWGYKYLVLDCLHYAAEGVGRADSYATRLEAFRSGMRAIRDAVGSDVILHGVSAPAIASAGLIDVLRTGPELRGVWHTNVAETGIRVPGRNALLRSPLRGAAWHADLGPLPLGESNLPAGERDVMLALLAQCADTRIAAGRLDGEDAAPQLDSLRFLLRGAPDGPETIGHVPNAMIRPIVPSTFVVDYGPRKLVTLYNWDEGEEQMRLPFEALGVEPYAPYLVYDVTDHKFEAANVRDEWVERSVHARSARTLNFVPMPASDTPVVIGSTLHFSQGVDEIGSMVRAGSSLRVEIDTALWRGRGGKLTLFRRSAAGASLESSEGAREVSVECEQVPGGNVVTVDLPTITAPSVVVSLALL